MNICIIRNAQIEKNPSMMRVLDANFENNKVLTISRDRDAIEKRKLKNKKFFYQGKELENYEITIPAERGKGVSNLFNLFSYQAALFKTLVKKRREMDVVHSFDLDAGLPSYIFTKLFRKKHVYHIGDFYVDSRGGIPSKLKNVIKSLEYKIINTADTTIICTEERRKQIEGSKPKNLTVIHNTPVTLPNKLNSISDPFPSGVLKMCYIGALSDRRFMREIVETVKENKNIHLLLGGLGASEEWIKKSIKNVENITYLGQVDYLDALSYYSYCDLMIAVYDPEVKNHKYSAPNKIYEAMFLGKPIIVAKDTGMNKIVGDNEIGFLIDYDKSALEKLLFEIEGNRSVLQKMGEKSKQIYDTYSWKEMKKRLNVVYSLL